MIAPAANSSLSPLAQTRARARGNRRWVNVALALCLLAPSVWMVATIPPLWRDHDAYSQVTQPPPRPTFAGHSPLYCILSRLPLWLGSEFERSRGRADQNPTGSLQQPTLTDLGVLGLIVLQHAAFVAASFFFLTTAMQLSWARILAGIFWATIAPFYTFAHCVGSETLSMICLLVLVALGLRIARRTTAPRREWIWFAGALLACLLARYVNLWLVLLLPLTFLCEWLRTVFRRRIGVLAGWNLRRALLAFAVGLCCVLAANGISRAICWTGGLRFHSRIGHTFLWRLRFLESMPPAERERLLQDVADRAASPEAKRMVLLLAEQARQSGQVDIDGYRAEAHARFFAAPLKRRAEKLDEALNEMAHAFLLPPTAPHIRAVREDFARARTMSWPELSGFLFQTTAYYFDHPSDMPKVAPLTTFTDHTKEALLSMPTRYRYFQIGALFNYNTALLCWTLALVVAWWLVRRAGKSSPSTLPYAGSLTVLGLVMMLSSCFLGELLPRYTLPMWELLITSFVIVLGAIVDSLTPRRIAS
ncbi:MAG: hypothetical protein ABI883_03350 [Chthoniobacterales bacterium]